MVAIYIILFISSLLFYILFVGKLSFYIFSFFLLTPIILRVLLEISKKSVHITFLKNKQFSGRNDKIPVILKIENRGFLPIPNCLISIAYTTLVDNTTEILKINSPIFPKNAQYLTLNISAQHYGTINFRISEIKIIDMLRLSKTKVPISKQDIFVSQMKTIVVPNYEELENNISNYTNLDIESDNYSKNKKGDDPSEIFNIREYTAGDKISRIHWNLTAKQDEIMIKDCSMPIANSIVIIVNLFIDKSSKNSDYLDLYDGLIETISLISNYLAQNHCNHKIIWYNSKINQNVTYEITDIDSYEYMISMLLQTPTCFENNDVVNNLIDDYSEISKCGHLIYCSSDKNDNQYSVLTDFISFTKYTSLLIEKNVDVYNNVLNNEDNCEIIRVSSNSVYQSIINLHL